jgi:murein DD-endopeptidase MepM/ murein hydrolase activator NlpD
VVLSRVGSVFLVLLSLLSFGLVYALNTDPGSQRPGFVHSIVDQILAAGLLPGSISDEEEEALAAPVVADALPGNSVVRSIFKREEEVDGVIRRTLVIGRGETLTSRLVAAGVSRTEILATLEALRPHVNPRKIRGGQEVVVLFKREATEANPAAEKYAGFELRDSTQFVSVARTDNDVFTADAKTITPEKQRFAKRGTVDDSLYEAGLKQGIPASILNTIIKTYSYNIDFQRELKSGDRFEVLYEQATDKDGHGTGEATLIYAALQNGGKIMPIYRVAMPGGGYEYFDAKGESIRKGLLRTPVEGARLTSGFGMRRHPIMGFSRMHKGIDFGAPYGSPIFAAGSGIVEEAARHSGYGNYVRIRHNGRISTAYAHMSRFGKGITRGTRINQGDVIGYVGSTGASTGPHLHYEIMVENQQVNPITFADNNTNSSLSGRQLLAFQDWRNKVHTQFERLIAAIDAAKVAQNTTRSLPQAQ